MNEEEEANLIAAAREARPRAYAPYSHYHVGAALLTASGKLYTGVNVENASYGHTICAERMAVFRAVEEGETSFRAIAVATTGGASPCGACRQVLREFDNGEMLVIMADENGRSRTTTLGELLPDSFTAGDLD
jgi:cytidine deaminase